MNTSMKTYQKIADLTQAGIFHKLRDEAEDADRVEKERGELADRMLEEIRAELISRLGVSHPNDDLAEQELEGGSGLAPRQIRKASAPKTLRAPAKKARRGGAEKRSQEELTLACKQFLAAVKARPGERMEQLRAGLGGETKDWVLPARKLLAEKKIRTKGEKRATAYFAK